MRPKFVKKTSIVNSVESLDISSAAARAAPGLLKALATLSGKTVRRFAVE